MQNNPQITMDQAFNYAANLLVKDEQTPSQVKKMLVAQGIDEHTAGVIVTNVENQISKAKKARANKDMLFGGLWMVGGTVLTIADIGAIFWGAIVFGLIQFIRGVANAA